MGLLKPEETLSFERGTFEGASPARAPKNSVSQCANGRILTDGTIERRWGTQRKHPNAITTGIGYGAAWHRPSGVSQILTFIDLVASKSEDGGVTWADVTGANVLTTGYYDFASMRVGSTTYLFAANGNTSVWRWDGTTLDALPNAPSGVKYLAVFNGRLWWAGHNGVLLQGSRVANPAISASPSGVTVQILDHGGDDITGLYQLGSNLLVFSADQTSYVNGYGEATLITATDGEGFSRSVGCIAHRTIRGVGDNQVCWLSRRGLEHYAPNTGITLLSRDLADLMESMNREFVSENPGAPSGEYDSVAQLYRLAMSTAGERNNQTLIIHMRHRGTGWIGAPTVDRIMAADGLLLSADADGYGQLGATGYELQSDLDGYAELATEGPAGEQVTEGADGYGELTIAESAPATLFVGPSTERGSAIHSLGYDGFVREHDVEGLDLDDAHSDGSEGEDVELHMVSRAFLFGNARQRKRARVAHVASTNSAEVSVEVRVRGGGVESAARTVTIPATALDQPKRKSKKVLAVGDDLRLDIRSTDRVRITLLGLSAEPLREPVR